VTSLFGWAYGLLPAPTILFCADAWLGLCH